MPTLMTATVPTLELDTPRIGPDERLPEWSYAETYYNEDNGATWQVITDYWLAGSPEARDGRRCPFASHLFAVQRTNVLSGDCVDRTYRPVSDS